MKNIIRPLIEKLNLKNKNSKIFKQLPDEEERQAIFLKYKTQIMGAASLLAVTTLVLSSTFALNYLNTHENNIYSTESYTLLVDGEEICKVRDPKVLDNIISQLENDLERNSELDLAFNNTFEVVNSKAVDKEILSENEIYNILKNEVDYSTLAYALYIDENIIGIVDSEYKAKSIIEEVKKYFSDNYDKNSIIEVATVEDVKIKQIEANSSEIQEPDDIVNYIIKGTNEERKYIVEKGDTYWTIAEYFNMTLDELISANPSADPERIQIGDELNLIVPKPFINVQVKRKVVQKEKIAYETSYEYVSYMFNDEEVINKAGEYGVSEIEAIVTEENGIQVAKEIVSEKVISEPSTEIVVTGTQDPPPKQGTGYFINPLPGSSISSRYGSRSGGFHRGQDMAKASGSSIKAADGGTVIFSGWNGSYGYMIDIDHGGGFTTRYAHCSELYVSSGEKVYQGKIIGAVGSTGVSTGPHLHFEVRKYGSTVNPASYIGVQYR